MDRHDMKISNMWFTWERRRRLAVVQVVCIVVYWAIRRRYCLRNRIGRPVTEVGVERHKVRAKLMNQLKSNENCRNIIRMGPQAFKNLCGILKQEGGLRATKKVTVEEQVAKFLYILSRNVKNREIAIFFHRSGETISRHFHRVLRAIISLEELLLCQPDGSKTPQKILNNRRFHPYFKNCVGAIGGTHVRVKVPREDAPRYHGKKDYPTQNVLAACSFDLKFTYVLPGWEGSASDFRVIKNALSREDKLIIPNGKFYLVGRGYGLSSGLIMPYKGVRYHLKEYSTHPPENIRELFNFRHASLRNAIERAFGVLKKRFPIIGSTTEPTYGVNTQSEIIIACCIVHNYLMCVDPDDGLIDEVDQELVHQSVDEEAHAPMGTNDDVARGELLRDSIAVSMWNDYVANEM